MSKIATPYNRTAQTILGDTLMLVWVYDSLTELHELQIRKGTAKISIPAEDVDTFVALAQSLARERP